VNVVDSSGWLEYFANGHNAAFFADAIQDTAHLIVPTVSLAEVFKRVLAQRGDSAALKAIAIMEQGHVVALDARLALEAARLGQQEGLPLADSVMLATARAFEATLWTQDADFKGLQGVRFVKA
jgi:predicted nucleic acid-binding protein